MDYLQLINEMKMRSDKEAQQMARHYGIDLSLDEIKRLRPLLDTISFHWIFTGIPESFIDQVRGVIGDAKTNLLLQKYIEFKG